MAERKSFLLRIDPELYAQLERWASQELRSLNGQIEFLLRQALREAGRSGKAESVSPAQDEPPTNEPPAPPQ